MERKGTGKLRVINDQKVFDCLINKKIGTKTKRNAQISYLGGYGNCNYLPINAELEDL